MNWRFWNWHRSGDGCDGCAAIEPLLSLYSDGMTSPAEARRIEAHLADCSLCRQVLRWMQATQQVIAARPIMPPPSDLRARIARAITESEAAKAPAAAARPVRRPLTLRPALAYGLSVALIAAVAGGIFLSAGHRGPSVVRNPTGITEAQNAPSNITPTVSGPKVRVPTSVHPNPIIAVRPERGPSLPGVSTPATPRRMTKGRSSEEVAANVVPDAASDNVTTSATPNKKISPVFVHRVLSLKMRTPTTNPRMADNRATGENMTLFHSRVPESSSQGDYVGHLHTGTPPHTGPLVAVMPPPTPQPVVSSPKVTADRSQVAAAVHTEEHAPSFNDIMHGALQQMSHEAVYVSHPSVVRGDGDEGSGTVNIVGASLK